MFDANGLNRYIFTGDDPINQVDPSGGQSCIQDVILGAIGAIGAVADTYLAGLGLFAVAAGEAALTGGLIFSSLFAPFALIAAAVGVAVVIDQCLGRPFSLQLF